MCHGLKILCQMSKIRLHRNKDGSRMTVTVTAIVVIIIIIIVVVVVVVVVVSWWTSG